MDEYGIHKRSPNDRLMTMMLKRLDDSAAAHDKATKDVHLLELASQANTIGLDQLRRDIRGLKKQVDGAAKGETKARTALWQKLGLAAVSLSALFASIAANL